MQNKRHLIVIIILIGLLTAVSGLLTNVVSGGIVMPLWLAVPLLIVVIGFGIGLAAWQFLLQADHKTVAVSQQNRQRMLERLRAFWITDVLEQSLHGAALITLGKVQM